MFRLPTVVSSKELLDIAFRKVSKTSVSGKSKIEVARKLSIKRIEVLDNTIGTTLTRYQKGFPTIEDLHPFYSEIVDILLGTDSLRQSLGALKWCVDRSRRMRGEYVRKIRPLTHHGRIEKMRKEAFGRISSLVEQISDDLDFLIDAGRKLRKMPTIDPNIPTIVIAGYPNVGKSMLVGAMSTGKPRVEHYPFTTKSVSLGHFDERNRRFQVIDTPGLLDREMDERNEIEKQAIAALRFLAHAIVFILDYSQTCGYETEKQEALLRTIRKQFQDIPIIEAENKSDLGRRNTNRIQVSAMTGEGVEQLRTSAVEAAMSRALEVSRAQEFH